MGDPKIDWPELARTVGSLRPDGETGSFELAREALDILLGPEMLRDAADFYITLQPGSELVRNILWLLQPWSVMVHCYQIYKESESLDDRIYAVELLRWAGDSRVIPWIPEFFADPDESIQRCGAGVLDQLLWGSGAREEDCAHLLELARRHSNSQVRQKAEFIDHFLKERKA